MHKGRLEAFSDGVVAIIITIMVLELKVPHGEEWADLVPLWPVFLSYVLSFVNVGLYWNNHHHMLQVARHVDGWVLWANLHLLFWLSLMPFTTAWMGENHFAGHTVALYGVDLLMCAIAYFILARQLARADGGNSALATAMGSDWKGRVPLIVYAAGIVIAFFVPVLALACYVAIAVLWFVPDRRMERVVRE
jgi:uncharacterized membrane protein